MKKLAVLFISLSSVSVSAQDRVAKFDTNGDAKVSYEELSAQCPNTMKALFSLADKDNDGFLTNVEMRTAKEYLFKKCKK
jgi:hypothetical protein